MNQAAILMGLDDKNHGVQLLYQVNKSMTYAGF